MPKHHRHNHDDATHKPPRQRDDESRFENEGGRTQGLSSRDTNDRSNDDQSHGEDGHFMSMNRSERYGSRYQQDTDDTYGGNHGNPSGDRGRGGRFGNAEGPSQANRQTQGGGGNYQEYNDHQSRNHGGRNGGWFGKSEGPNTTTRGRFGGDNSDEHNDTSLHGSEGYSDNARYGQSYGQKGRGQPCLDANGRCERNEQDFGYRGGQQSRGNGRPGGWSDHDESRRGGSQGGQ